MSSQVSIFSVDDDESKSNFKISVNLIQQSIVLTVLAVNDVIKQVIKSATDHFLFLFFFRCDL